VKSLTCIVAAVLLAVTAHARAQVVRRNPEHERRIEIVPDLADRDSRMTLPTQSKRRLERLWQRLRWIKGLRIQVVRTASSLLAIGKWQFVPGFNIGTGRIV
jgi:hypothetical protein